MNRNSVIFRLQDDNPQALQSVKQVVAYLALAGIAVTDPATQHDYCAAAEALIDAINPASPDLEAALEQYGKPVRPASDDTRPLYQRLDDEDPELVRVIRKYANRLSVIAILIADRALRKDYQAAVRAFFDAIGVPSEREFAAQPQNYPGVRPR